METEKSYTYWTIELYDQRNGVRGGGGLGVLAADTRRIAEKLGLPFTLITPFYPWESYQVARGGAIFDEHRPVSCADFGFKKVGAVEIRGDNTPVFLDVVEKKFETTRIVAVTEPNFGELYAGMSGSDHRLYQEVSLGFGGYAALKLVGVRPAVMQLNEVATIFAALARLDELTSGGETLDRALDYTRKRTLYTNHTLVQAAEAEFSLSQFERFVFSNLKSAAVRRWVEEQFVDEKIKLSALALEIAGRRNGVSKLHARVADYRDRAGNKVEFRAVTNGIDLKTWTLPETLEFYHAAGILSPTELPAADYVSRLERLDFTTLKKLKKVGRDYLNRTLLDYPDQDGKVWKFREDDFIFDFKRRFVDYKRPELPFRDPSRLRAILEPFHAHYVLAGRLHTGDAAMMEKLKRILEVVAADDYLREHVHYLPNYDEKLAFSLSVGSDAAVNLPIVGLEACGTSWMKDVANLNILISTHDGGVADAGPENYLNVTGADEATELESLYARLAEALVLSRRPEELVSLIRRQLAAYLPVISGTRMLREYIDYIFSGQ